MERAACLCRVGGHAARLSVHGAFVPRDRARERRSDLYASQAYERCEVNDEFDGRR